ncbi:MAG: hypothetical protein PHQ90_01145 [Sulfuricurvum sp.]|nr:hypothetical protein [Sulfuricurvum sp.]
MSTLILDQQIETSIKNILEEFNSKEQQLQAFKDCIFKLLSDILDDTDIKTMAIKKRVKKKDSIKDKIISKAKKYPDATLYSSLSDIHDIVGLRIVVYLENDIDRVTEKIKKEFNVDEENSVDKRNHEYDRFGYLSNHLVLEIDDNRIKQTEYKKFKNIKFELQIRSGLQDVWAELEHKLGYKAKETLPYDQKRMLSRLAASLEIIDNGFKEIHTPKPRVSINQTSLFDFISSSQIIKSIDSMIQNSRYTYTNQEDVWSIALILKNLNYLGFDNLSEINSTLDTSQDHLILFIEQMLDKAIPIQYTNGISLIYLCLLLAIEKFTKDQFVEYLDKTEIREGKNAQYFYKTVNNCYNRMLLIKQLNLKGRI